MIVVTGGAGFIGSNLVSGLNAEGHRDIVVVDDLEDGRKFRNLVGLSVMDYYDKDDFLALIQHGQELREPITALFHAGACAVTTEWDGRYLLRNNYAYSRDLLDYCLERRIPFLYASSAAVYGTGRTFRRGHEAPVNAYGYSKHLFDEHVFGRLPNAESPIVGLRYFNVYGPHEAHKGSMASVIYHFDRQIRANGRVRLFAGSHGYADGEQRRDFVHVADVVAVNLWFLAHPECSGVFNVGTGTSRSFNEVARAVLDWHGHGAMEYVPFPEELTAAYQAYTEADLASLRGAGYGAPFLCIEDGVERYLEWLAA